MSQTAFDTLGYFERLKAAGVPESQARAQIDVIREVIEDKLATKRDLKEVEYLLRSDLEKMEYRLTIRLGGIIAASVAAVAALVKIL